MLGVYLKAKLEIEAKVEYLQKFYLDLIKISIVEPNFNEKNNVDKATEILREKIQDLYTINREYKTTLDQYEETSISILEAQKTSEELEIYLDQLFESLELEIPKDLIKEEISEECTQHRVSIQPESEEEEEDSNADKENSEIYQAEAESDKEAFESDSEDYFSPNILCRKSTKEDNIQYTPAIKSHSKNSARKF